MLRTQDEILNKASNLKVKLIKRAESIEQMMQTIMKSESGMIRALHPERMDTLKTQLDDALKKQTLDAYVYATVRWVLGVTDDIDATDLELQK